MTTTLFKDQAKRLAEHLTRVHGIKLKHASILEAVAGLHGRPDWNTLVACGAAGETTPAALQPVSAPLGTSDAMSLHDWISFAVRDDLSELVFSPERDGYAVFGRRDGTRVSLYRGQRAHFELLVDEFNHRVEVDARGGSLVKGQFMFEQGAAGFTVSALAMPLDSKGTCLTLGWTNPKETLWALADLGISKLASWRRAIAQPAGMCIIAGAIVSGTTTTLAASVNDLLRMGRSVQVLDPELGESVVPGAHQGDAGDQTFDVLVLGDLRTARQLTQAVEAASRGQMVLAAVQAYTPDEALRRLREAGATEAQLNTLVRGVLVQNLVRRTCTQCKGVGCSLCRNSGYKGRTMVSECVAAAAGGSILREVDQFRTAPTIAADAVSKARASVTDMRELERVFGALIFEA
jgi:general secretion pathway protein E